MKQQEHEIHAMESLGDGSTLMFPLEEYRSRVGRLRQVLSERGIDVYLAAVPENMFYFGGFDPAGVYFYYQHLCVTPHSDKCVLLVHKAESEIARTGCCVDDIRIWGHGEDPMEYTLEILKDLGLGKGGTLGLEMSRFAYQIADYLRLEEALPGVRIVDVGDVGDELRVVKSPAEIEYMRKAAKFSDIGLEAAYRAMRPGVSEFEVYARTQEAMHRAGSTHQPFPTLLGTGPRAGLFHGMPSDRIIEKGDLVEIEVWGTSQRYTTNIPRTVVVGRASDEVRMIYDIVQEAFWKGFEAVAPGTPIGEIDRVCREARKGYEDYIPARSGFGLGINFSLYPYPSVHESDPHILEPGMIFTLEPSISQYHGNSVIIGNVVLVTEDGAECLSHTDLEAFEL